MIFVKKLLTLADQLDQRKLFKEANIIDRIIYAVISFDKPVRVYYDNDADGIFSALIFKYYSGADVISMTPVNPGFELQKEGDVTYVVLDARSKDGNEDLRIDHHEGGIIKESDIVDTSVPSCAGLVSRLFEAPIDPKVLHEMDSLDSGNPTVLNWDAAETKLNTDISQEALEHWEVFEKVMSDLSIDRLDTSSIEAPGTIEEIGNARAFGNWEMPGEETDGYLNYFINVEYPKDIPFTVVGRMRSSKKPEEPYQIFIANSPARKDINIGNMLEQFKRHYEMNAGGRADVGGCNFVDKNKAQQVYEAILNIVK